MDQHDNAKKGATKPVWQRPKLEKLGNLKDFVQTGNAFGKSGLASDGESTPGGEMMGR